ncbi:hypothetical protein B296_00028432, partial [Ensete ventricosum]
MARPPAKGRPTTAKPPYKGAIGCGQAPCKGWPPAGVAAAHGHDRLRPGPLQGAATRRGSSM